MAARTVVLVVIKGLGIGGAERLIAESARFWDRDRFDYRVAYLLPWKDQLVAEIEGTGTPVEMLGGKGSLGPSTALRLRRWIGGPGTSIVHAHLPASAVLTRLVSRVPVVYTEHNVADSYRQPTRLLNRITYGRNAAVIAVSQAVARSLHAYPGPAARVIENGVHLQQRPAGADLLRHELLGEGKSALIVHVGNIRPHKGHATLIRAAKHIQEAAPGALVVSVGGEKHPGDLDRVRKEAADAGVSDSIVFLGRRENAADFIAAADIVVNPSDAEGLPVALLEAMALARPVVATAVGGVPELIASGINGVLVEPGRPERLATEVLRLLADPLQAGLLGEQARETIREHHSLEAMVRQVEALYDEVLGV